MTRQNFDCQSVREGRKFVEVLRNACWRKSGRKLEFVRNRRIQQF